MSEVNSRRCTIHGYLYGAICENLKVLDRIEGAQVVAVPANQDQQGVINFAQSLRRTDKQIARDIDEVRFKQVTDNAALHGRTDKQGGFCLVDPDYQGGVLDLYICVERVPAPTLDKGSVELGQRCYLYMGAYRPFLFGDEWYLICVVPSIIWCRIRRKADLWVVVGRVTPCADATVGLGGLKVTARDADIVQHDVLGTATTNASGVFRIDYLGSAFRKGTWLNIELFGGPDVYFRIVDADGNVLLNEPASSGRQAGRRDRRPCFCVHLCVDVPQPPKGNVPSVWTKVGKVFTIPDATSLNDFDANGYGGALKYAFHGAIRLLGSAPRVTNAGRPVEYRFLVSDTTTPNGGPAPADASFDRIVGIDTNVNLFAATLIGQMVRYSPYKTVDVYAQQVDLDPEGWLDVETSIARTFAAHPTLTPADIPDFEWVDLDALMAINTAGLTTQPNVPNVGNPGVAVPAGNRIAIERKAIRFEIREVVDKVANLFNAMPGSGTTLNNIVVNNNAAYIKVAMKEHLSSTACTPLSGSPHVAFTAHHPHLQSVNINVRSNDGSYNHNLNDAATKPATSDAAIPLAGNTNSPGVNHLHNPSVNLPAGLHKCTYIVTLSVLRRLHTGDDAVIANTPQTSFYYEP